MTRWFYLGVLVVVAAFAVSGYVYVYKFGELPEKIPVHWNIHGVPDRVVDKQDAWMNFWIFPPVMAGFLLLTLVLPWLSPKSFSIEPFRDTYGYVMTLVQFLFGYIHVLLIWNSFHPEAPAIRPLIGGMCIFFALMGNVLGRVRRNFWVGIRTPWTLASDKVWNATHRLGAWLLTAFGVVGAIVVIAGVSLIGCTIVLIAGIFFAMLVPVGYSLVLYKRLERQGTLNDSP